MSSITRDVGNIAIIEHDGSNIDFGTATARPALMRRFYETHGDNYDFLVTFTNFEFDAGDALAFHTAARSQVAGIGLPVARVTGYEDAPSRLQGMVQMTAIENYRRLPQSLTPGSRGFLSTLNVLAHEIAHQWLAHVHYLDQQAGISSALLGKDGSHWSYLLDSDASVMYGSDWTREADGHFKATEVRRGYSALDLYLMGMLPASKVAPFTLLRNPAIDPLGLPILGAQIEATPEVVTVGQVIGAEGERAPNYLQSPKAFRVAFIFLTAPGVDPSPADLEAVETVRRFFPGHFFALTRGVGIADTTLADAAPLAPAAAPDLDRALTWLMSKQSVDGAFRDSPHTSIRDTSVAMSALIAGGVSGPPRDRALASLRSAPRISTDALSRAVASIARDSSAAEKSTLRQALLPLQNADGGFGAAQGFTSDALDTALALTALKALPDMPPAVVTRAIRALGELGTSDGWATTLETPASILATSHALLALLEWRDLPETTPLIAAGVLALASRQNQDGGFGEGPSTAYATALALEALLAGGAVPDVINAATAWLEREQQVDGSWEGARYPTALVLSALKGGSRPNLTAPSQDMTLSSTRVDEGEQVTVRGTVLNSGRSVAPPSEARLYNGPPGAANLIGTQAVPALPPGGSHPVVFEISTTDLGGEQALYLVADGADQVAESREDDNTAVRNLRVNGRQPDLTILPGDLTASPAPGLTSESITLSIRITNVGTKAAPASRAWIFDGPPGSGGMWIGEVAVPPLNVGEVISLTVPWQASAVPGDHVLTAVVDATYLVPEAIETNNQASLPFVVSAAIVGVDLEVLSLTATPDHLTALPQSIDFRIVVRNLGSEAAMSVVRLDADESVTPIDVPIQLPGRSTAVYTARLTLTTGGTRTVTATADPDGTIDEADEGNNSATFYLADPESTIDVEVRAGDVVVSSADLTAGELLTVRAVVRNRGTTRIEGLPVILGRGPPGPVDELVRKLVSLAPGETAAIEFAWTTSIVGDAVPLSVSADPFNILLETDETNNVVSLPTRIRESERADLRIRGADTAIEPDPLREGSPATLSVRVTNPTPVAVGPFSIKIYVGDPLRSDSVLMATSTVSGIGARGDQRFELQTSSVPARGLQGIYVVVDSENTVDEYDETNNIAFRPFAIDGLPDLVLTTGDVTVNPPFPRTGEPVQLRALVRNLGAQTVSTVVVRLNDLSTTPTILSELTMESLLPGASGLVEFTWTPAAEAGEHHLSITVDSDNAIREQNEGNNEARINVLVQNSGLYLTNRYFSPNGDGILDTTTLGYRASGPVSVDITDERGR
ncbi:MAG: CARDB domain-containing protein, partial [Vicinamibacteria bacterium]